MLSKRPYVYVASSWRNEKQPLVVRALKGAAADVYDFREPCKGATGFHWSDIDPEWKDWSPERFVLGLDHPVAVDGFRADMSALQAADACILVMPCGRSAHLELGYCIGAGKPTAILLTDGEPELMYSMADIVTDDLLHIVNWVLDMRPTPGGGPKEAER